MRGQVVVLVLALAAAPALGDERRKKGHAVQLVGREAVAGAKADKLKVVLRGGVVRYDYVDIASHMVVRSDVPRWVRRHREELESTFSDFRKVSGIVFPHLIEIHVKG